MRASILESGFRPRRVNFRDISLPIQSNIGSNSLTWADEEVKTGGIQRWTGLVMVGDGLAGLVWPREYLRKLQVGPEPLNEVLEMFVQRPRLTRILCALEVGLGAWIFTR
jgi:hypothetical protein